jgi:virE protein
MFGYSSSISRGVVDCTPELFRQVVRSAKVVRLCAEIADAREMKLRGEMSKDDFEHRKSECKRRLPVFLFHATFPKGRRVNAEAVPTGLSIFDIDHIPAPRETWREIAPRAEALGIVLAHVSPSLEGLRLVFVLPQGMALAEGQKWMASQLGMSDYDESVKDYARCSFAVPESYILYESEKLFASPVPQPVSESTEGLSALRESEVHETPLKCLPAPVAHQEAAPQKGVAAFRGIPYDSIVARWWEKVGGEPQEGERNVKLHQLAVNLRAICDNNVEKLMRVIPHMGLSDQEMRSVLESACRDQPKGLSKLLKTILAELEHEARGDEAPEPIQEMGKSRVCSVLCRGLRESVYGVPERMQMAVLCAVLPLAASYADGVEVEYCDGKRMRLGLMSVIVGPQASGKSACKEAVDVWLRQMDEEDALARRKEDEWKQARKCRKANEKAPRDPEVMIRNVPVTISCSTLLKRMKNAHGHTLYSFGEELDTLHKTNGAGSWSTKYDVYRLAFDNGCWGQDYNSDQAESGVVEVAYNWTILGTYGALRKCFRTDNVENGLSSRLMLAEMPDNSFAPMPRFKGMNDAHRQAISESVDRLREAKGFVDTPRLRRAMANWVEARRLEAMKSADTVMDTYRKRAAVIGFRCGVVYRLLYGKESNDCLKFAVMMADYVLREQSRLFGEVLLEQAEPVSSVSRQGANTTIFDELPTTFTLHDLEALKHHHVSTLRVVIHRWKASGWIERVGKGIWKKK